MRDANETVQAQRRRLLAAACAAPMLAAITTAVPSSAASAESGLIQRAIGGRSVPAIGLGTWRGFDLGRGDSGWSDARATLARFHALGGRLVDSSPMYGAAEAAVGALSEELGINAGLWLATKVWTHGAEAGEAQLAASLALLRRDALELVQVHNLVDLDTQMEMLTRAREEGRVRLVGISHYHAGAHPAVLEAMQRHRPDVVQINYSVLEPEAADTVLPAARDAGLAVLVNRPFAEGRLLGRLQGQALPGVAAELGARSWAQLLLKWILAEPGVTVVLAGTRNPAHVEDNLGAARGPLPDAAQRRAIRDAVRG